MWSENTTAVTTVTATDPDAGATLTYSIIGGADAAKFTINAATGVLTLCLGAGLRSADRCRRQQCLRREVQVSDGTLTDTQAIAVTVTNVRRGAGRSPRMAAARRRR